MIRIASYNMHKAVGTDRRRNPRRILDVLEEVDADIVALQEADRRLGKRESAIPSEMIRDESQYTPIWLNSREHSIGWHGNAILVKDALIVHSTALVAIPSLEPRGAVMAVVETIRGPLCVVGMHLDLSGLRRHQQIRAIRAQVARDHAALPLILMGDCNEWSKHGGSLTAFSGLHMAETGASFHSRRPIARLDRIFANEAITILRAGTHHSLKARYASDHLPVWADIDLI
jgi:endonuclease/exonuclease/phosphatase family metal-dependent hydrolase